MTLLTSRGAVFVALNGVRIASFVTLILVFAAIVVLMAQDSHAYNTLRANGELADADDTCDYLPYSDIPTTPWGLFWVQFNRFLLLCLCLLCAIAEISAGLLDGIFDRWLPILGTRYSTVPMGITQIFMSTTLLSHFMTGYPLIPPWLLFFVGIINITLGIAFGATIKSRRSVMRTQRDEPMHQSASMQASYDQTYPTHKSADVERAPPTKTTALLRSLAHTKLGDSLDRVNGTSKSSRGPEHGASVPRVRRIGRPSEAFRSGPYMPGRTVDSRHMSQQEPAALLATGAQRPGHARNPSCSTYASATGAGVARSLGGLSVHSSGTTPEMLRQRARIENWRAEREQELRDGMRHDGHGIGGTYGNARRTPSEEVESLHEHIAVAQTGAARDFAPMHTTEGSKHWHTQLDEDRDMVKPPRPATPFQTALRRRTLVLSKMVQNVKRGSVNAARRYKGCAGQGERRTSRASLSGRSASPSRSRRGLKPTVDLPGPWIEVDKSTAPPQPPAASYAKGGGRLAPGAYDYSVAGSEAFGAPSEYHSMLPIASRYAHT